MNEHHVCEYFFVCGLDSTRGLTTDVYSECSPNLSPYDISFRSDVLEYYPGSRKNSIFDVNAVRKLSLPAGVKICTSDNVCDPCFNGFVITKEDGSRLYGLSYIFYERLSCNVILQQFNMLQRTHANVHAQQTDITIQGASVVNRNLFAYQARAVRKRTTSSSTVRLPHLRPRMRSSSSVFCDLSTSVQSTLSVRSNLCISRCVGTISQYPCVNLCKCLLLAIYQHWHRGHAPSHMSEVIGFLLHQLHLPAPGFSTQCRLLHRCAIVTTPHTVLTSGGRNFGELPLFEHSLPAILRLVGADTLVTLWLCLLLETRVILYSQDTYQLYELAESLLTLLFPFVWHHVYVPVLPHSSESFLEAPVPFLIGVCAANYSPGREHLVSFTMNSAVPMCMLDLQSDILHMNMSIPVFPSHTDLLNDITRLFNEHQYRNTEDLYTQKPLGERKVDLQHQYHSQDRDLSPLDKSDLYQSKFDNFSYTHDQLFNLKFRETLLFRVIQLFYPYERFVICPHTKQPKLFLDHPFCFDIAAFFSDKSHLELQFLFQFCHTQLFSSFIERKIRNKIDNLNDDYINLFDARIQFYRDNVKIGQKQCFQYCLEKFLALSQCMLTQRLSNVTMATPSTSKQNSTSVAVDCNHLLSAQPEDRTVINTCGELVSEREDFLRFSPSLIKSFATSVTSDTFRNTMPDLIKTRSFSDHNSLLLSSFAFSKDLNQPDPVDFVEECKHITRQLLVGRLRYNCEQIFLNSVGVAENTLIANLCDLLEAVWCTGLSVNQVGNSFLWDFILEFLSLASTDFHLVVIEKNIYQHLDKIMQNSSVEGGGRGSGCDHIESPVTLLSQDVGHVLEMRDIKSSVGYQRAWIRLSLERKMLACHLSTILSIDSLLKKYYSEDAFLFCEDERDKFICHLLSLNAIQCYCFTNSYLKTVVTYTVCVVAANSGTGSHTSAQPYVKIFGTLSSTDFMPIPKHTDCFDFKHTNLGVLNALVVGHNNAGFSPAWFLHYVSVRNSVTGQLSRFGATCWFGRDVSDSSCERLLSVCDVNCELNSTPLDPARFSVQYLKESLQDSVSALVEYMNTLTSHYDSPLAPPPTEQSSSRCARARASNAMAQSSIHSLLCARCPHSVLHALTSLFLHGFRSTRYLIRSVFLWDFVLSVCREYKAVEGDRNTRQTSSAERETRQQLCDVIASVSSCLDEKFGKDERFRVFILTLLRDGNLVKFTRQLFTSDSSRAMYKQHAFLRSSDLFEFFAHHTSCLLNYQLPISDIMLRNY